MINLMNGDCLEVLKTLPDDSIDSIVTDPPYGLRFMGKKWDYDVPKAEIFKEMLRVLKPGGHMLCACGTRTQHRMAVNIEDAGFEIRDVITWLYGSGFPKSMDISKAIDKAAGAEREIIGEYRSPENTSGKSTGENSNFGIGGLNPITAPATESAKQWQGWGTALKPACEFWTLARKPLSEKTVAANVLKHSTGGININGCRVKGSEIRRMCGTTDKSGESSIVLGARSETHTSQGRWPANLILDEEAAMALDEQSGSVRSSGAKNKTAQENNGTELKFNGKAVGIPGVNTYSDTGGASRFFYVAKASKSERNQGCDSMPLVEVKTMGERGADLSGDSNNTTGQKPALNQNFHPTVKPIKLMTYLCRLITPPRGTVLDPFMGSGSTGVAAIKEGFSFVGIEREPSYFEICNARISRRA